MDRYIIHMDHLITQAVADKVAAEILKSGRSKSSVAVSVGIPATTFNRKIHGHVEFTVSEILRIAEELNVAPSRLVPALFTKAVAA